ncbi:MAG: ADP-ribosylglycohydrolase family protein [Chloroflexi bacterium]|nr:ADP-ribosylglycohydrolase family protein [Chloroflexota bacterium]
MAPVAETERVGALADRARGALLGLACGDALGTTVEFRARGSFVPVTDMVGGGQFGLRPGEWTDDTSMALCLAESLVTCAGFDARDQMQRYCRWMDEAYLSSNGKCFDIGNATGSALRRFQRTGEPFSGSTDPHSAGNGSLMRLAPIPIWRHASLAEAVFYSGESARTTHGAAECVAATRLFGAMLCCALAGQPKEQVLAPASWRAEVGALPTPALQAIADGAYRGKREAEIRSGGYVVHTLEAALWCVTTTGTYAEAVLRAANLGDDADTVAAVTGQLAGALYGADAIPRAWRERLVMVDRIVALADALLAIGR